MFQTVTAYFPAQPGMFPCMFTTIKIMSTACAQKNGLLNSCALSKCSYVGFESNTERELEITPYNYQKPVLRVCVLHAREPFAQLKSAQRPLCFGHHRRISPFLKFSEISHRFLFFLSSKTTAENFLRRTSLVFCPESQPSERSRSA